HDHDHDHDHEHEEFEFVEAPAFTLDYKGECRYEVQVTIPVANEKKQAQESYDELRSTAEVPGFRKGKAPQKLLENKFGKAVRNEVTEKLVSAAFQKLVKDEDLKPIALPDIDGLEELKQRKEDDPLQFTFKFEVAPRCELGKYRGIEIERPVVTVDEKDVDEAIEQVRQRQALYETLEDGEAQAEDQVIIDFQGTIDGQTFAGGSADNYPYILGSGRFFKEFEAVLTGAKAGQELKTDVVFPADYGNANLAGKTANFIIKVNEIKRRQMPEVNDEFAQQADYTSLEDMREKVKADLQSGSTGQSQQIAESRALEKVIEASTFEIPKSLIESASKDHYEREVRRLMSLRMPASKIAEREEELRKQAEEQALRNIKAFTVVNEIGEAEGIEVTEEDFEKEAASLVERTGLDVESISRYIQHEEHRDTFEDRLFRQKALAIVMEHAQITDKEVPREELDKENEATID
ncbi:MAG: trigger factor, partial [Candidatus Hydrogenedentes bacterium]|nr:trigger factor [Candidatus Hydrogenedentota bacterium]